MLTDSKTNPRPRNCSFVFDGIYLYPERLETAGRRACFDPVAPGYLALMRNLAREGR